jgi:hypothetical protein
MANRQQAERRLDQWAKAGMCDQLHLEVDRGKPGSKLHLVSERHGLPLTAAVTAANVNDTLLFAALLDDVPAVLIPHHATDRAAWGRLADPAGTLPVANRADAVVAVVLPAPGGSLGPGLGTLVRVRAAGLCACVLQAALTAAGLVLQHGRVAAERPQ